MSPPAGTITFLFTDVEGSTRLWERSPEAMRAALSRHDTLSADVIAACQGLLIKGRGEGDSLFSVFDKAPHAARAACSLQQAFAAEAWPPEVPLRVRMALHTGEADLREKDYYGVAVNRCARLRQLAHGGQVLLSSLTRSLVHEALPEGAELIDLGPKKLRDLAEPEYVYELSHPRFPTPIPMPELEEPAPHASVRFLTSLVQRETDLAEFQAFLTNAQRSVLSPSGPAKIFYALREAHRAGLADARKMMDSQRAAQAAPALGEYDAVLQAVLEAHPARQTVSRLGLLRALATGAGLTLWEAKRVVDDFCRRVAPDVAGYDGGLLKSLGVRLHRENGGKD